MDTEVSRAGPPSPASAAKPFSPGNLQGTAKGQDGVVWAHRSKGPGEGARALGLSFLPLGCFP